MIVYLITNLANGKKYVGQTIQPLKRRWDFHVCKRSGCLALKAAMQKYGKDNFKIEEIYRAASLEELCRKEKEFIASLNTLAPNGYNLTTGGDRPVYSDESRKKMSESASNRSSWAKGKTMSDPRVAKSITAATKALKEIYGESSAAKGIKWSDESRKRLSKSKSKVTIFCDQNGKTYISPYEAARDLKLRAGNIYLVAHGKRAHTGGYTFKRIVE